MLLTGEKKPGDSLQKKCMVPGLNGAEFTLESLCVSARLQDTPSGTTKNKIQALRHARRCHKACDSSRQHRRAAIRPPNAPTPWTCHWATRKRSKYFFL